MAMGKFKLALKDFETVKKVRPRDKDALSKYTECNKIVRQIAFEKAISVQSSRKKPSETVDLDTLGKEGGGGNPQGQ
jgi:serine/threonine-protein phosphatase 5